MKQGNYEDILYTPCPIPLKHPRMSIANRACQFMPFAALTGYEAAVKETARQTQPKKQLSEDQKLYLDRQLLLCKNLENEHQLLELTYFIQDPLKAGGFYHTMQATLKRIDIPNQFLVLEDLTQVCLDDIFDIVIVK